MQISKFLTFPVLPHFPLHHWSVLPGTSCSPPRRMPHSETANHIGNWLYVWQQKHANFFFWIVSLSLDGILFLPLFFHSIYYPNILTHCVQYQFVRVLLQLNSLLELRIRVVRIVEFPFAVCPIRQCLFGAAPFLSPQVETLQIKSIVNAHRRRRLLSRRFGHFLGIHQCVGQTRWRCAGNKQIVHDEKPNCTISAVSAIQIIFRCINWLNYDDFSF